MSTKTKTLRNVALLGHSGSGKTTFIEAMLYESGAIKRRGSIEAKNTVSDCTDIEHERESTIFSHLMHAKWRENKINILDTPGFDDFIGEVISSLKVSDTALILLNASTGVEVGTDIVWEYTQTYGTPTIFVINQMDHPKAEFDSTLEQAIRHYGSKVVPIQYPYNSGEGFNSIIDTLRMVMYVFPEEGGKPEKQPIPESEMAKAKEMHNTLVEIAAENEEGLMEKYFEKGTLNEDELAHGLMIALALQQFFPVFCASGLKDMGTGRVMGFINDIAPSPADRPSEKLEDGNSLACDSNDDTTIFIYKTLFEPQVGMVSYFKVYSGVIKAGDELLNADKKETERLAQIFISNGKDRIPVQQLEAGDLGVTVKLRFARTNQTMNSNGLERKIKKIKFPESRISVAVTASNVSDTEKMVKVLHMIEDEDPTLYIEQSPELNQTILYGQGQLQLDLIKQRIEKEHKVEMLFERPKIPYRETITSGANAEYRHKKQSGGAGQFGEVHMRIEAYYDDMPEPEGFNIRSKEIEDLPWGGKFAFYWAIVGGAIDNKYQNAIKKGIMQQMSNGPLTGSRSQNVRVIVYDGKMHSVDSNDISFQLAASAAFKEAFYKSHPQLMEPIYEVSILCPENVTGDIMGDLQSRRATIAGMDVEGIYQKIIAYVPSAELYQYSSTLRSLSQGRAKFSQKFHEYQLVPSHVQDELVKNSAHQDIE